MVDDPIYLAFAHGWMSALRAEDEQRGEPVRTFDVEEGVEIALAFDAWKCEGLAGHPVPETIAEREARGRRILDDLIKARGINPGRTFIEEVPELYDAARDASHYVGLPWTDPRTGITYPPPAKP